jgi:hypothetical protein
MYSNLLTVITSFSEQNGIPVTRWVSMVQLKIQSVKLARKYLGRVYAELEATQGGPDEEELMLQGVRFAFRVHQVYTTIPFARTPNPCVFIKYSILSFHAVRRRI